MSYWPSWILEACIFPVPLIEITIILFQQFSEVCILCKIYYKKAPSEAISMINSKNHAILLMSLPQCCLCYPSQLHWTNCLPFFRLRVTSCRKTAALQVAWLYYPFANSTSMFKFRVKFNVSGAWISLVLTQSKMLFLMKMEKYAPFIPRSQLYFGKIAKEKSHSSPAYPWDINNTPEHRVASVIEPHVSFHN